MTETIFYLVRHAQSHPSSSKYHTDWPLSEIGKKQALELSHLLQTLRIDTIISSPYLRCRQTIEPYLVNCNMSYSVEEDFRERLISKEIIEGFYDVWYNSWEDFNYSLPGCESSYTAQNRFVKAIEKQEKINQGKSILISTHGNVMGLFLNWIDNKYGREEAENLRNPDILKVIKKDNHYHWDKNFVLDGIDNIATDYKETKVD